MFYQTYVSIDAVSTGFRHPGEVVVQEALMRIRCSPRTRFWWVVCPACTVAVTQSHPAFPFLLGVFRRRALYPGISSVGFENPFLPRCGRLAAVNFRLIAETPGSPANDQDRDFAASFMADSRPFEQLRGRAAAATEMSPNEPKHRPTRMKKEIRRPRGG